MGAADIIPGISGGTIAFITHIYERLIRAVSNVLGLPKKLFAVAKKEATLKETLQEADLAFLAVLVAGIISAVAVMSHAIPAILNAYPKSTYAFFCGLIVAASVTIYRSVTTSQASTAWLALGIVAGYATTRLPTAQASTNNLLLFVLGAIVICAMLLPGISGSYLLLVAGQYEAILQAVQQPITHAAQLAALAAGALVGAALFSHAIAYLLANYKNATLALLTGLMLGALAVPIRAIQQATSNESWMLIAAAAILGAAIVTYLEYLRAKNQPASA